MYKIKSGEHEFEISSTDDGFVVDGRSVSWDEVRLDSGHLHVLIDNRSYRVEIIEKDKNSKNFNIKVNGHTYSVNVKDRFDLLLEKMGMAGATASRVNSVRAPMPGLIIDLKVKDGDSVKTGDTLLILEAMKMENIIKAPGDGTIKSVKVKMGEGVEKNQVLIEF